MAQRAASPQHKPSNTQTPKTKILKKDSPPPKKKQACYQTKTFFDLAENLSETQKTRESNTSEIGISADLKNPNVGPKTCAHTFGRISHYSQIFVSNLFAMLCIDGHKIPKHILKPYFIVLCYQKTYFAFFFQTDKELFHHYPKQAIIRKVLDNRLQAPKHKTLTFAQKSPEPL